MATKGWTEMDPLGTLIVSLGTLIVLDLAALQLGGPRRPRTRTRAARSRWTRPRPLPGWTSQLNSVDDRQVSLLLLPPVIVSPAEAAPTSSIPAPLRRFRRSGSSPAFERRTDRSGGSGLRHST